MTAMTAVTGIFRPKDAVIAVIVPGALERHQGARRCMALGIAHAVLLQEHGVLGKVNPQHLFRQFSERQSCHPEINGTHIAERSVKSLVVVPPYVIVDHLAQVLG